MYISRDKDNSRSCDMSVKKLTDPQETRPRWVLGSVCRFKSLSYYRHLTTTPSFGAQIAGAGGTPRLSYLPCQTMELPLDGDNTKDS